jgi:hypothetical protein
MRYHQPSYQYIGLQGKLETRERLENDSIFQSIHRQEKIQVWEKKSYIAWLKKYKLISSQY